MPVDRDFNLGNVLWLAGGVALGYMMKEAIDDWMLDQELRECPEAGMEETTATEQSPKQ